MEEISNSEWFSYITGVGESEFRENVSKYVSSKKSKYTTPEMIIKNNKTGKKYSCGSLELIPLKELRAIDTTSQGSSTFEIIIILDNESRPQVSVDSQQSMKQYSNAVFLVASNFNGVESVSEDCSPNSRNFVTNYIYDPTQGPSASLGAPAAAIQRCIFPFYDKKKEPSTWTQTKEKQIEILGGIPNYTIMNGYPLLNKDVKDVTESDYDNYLCCIHSNVEVTFSQCRSTFKPIEKDERNHIDQVFAAALNVGQGMSGYSNRECTEDKPMLRQLPLDCGYEAAYLTAIRNKRDTVVLTKLGGGVFGNSFDDINKSIIRAHLKYGVKNNGTIKKVVLPLFSIGADADDIVELLKQNNIPYKITKYAKNKVVEE